MITIITFLGPEEARVARSYLAANGISALLKGEESLSAMPHLSMGAQSWQLMVSDDDAPQAKRLLAIVEQQASPSQGQDNQPKTLRTRHRNIAFIAALVASAFIILFGRGQTTELEKHQPENLVRIIS